MLAVGVASHHAEAHDFRKPTRNHDSHSDLGSAACELCQPSAEAGAGPVGSLQSVRNARVAPARAPACSLEGAAGVRGLAFGSYKDVRHKKQGASRAPKSSTESKPA